MNLQQLIKDACEDTDAAEFRNDYSGRGMFGSHCVGIVGSQSDCMTIIGHVIKEISFALSRVAREAGDPDYSATMDDLNDTENNFDKAVDTMMGFRTDSMGLRSNIYYWPGLEPIVEAEDDISPFNTVNS